MRRRPKDIPPLPDDPRPRYFDCQGLELLEYCARDRAGEFIIEEIIIGPGNADYRLKVRYPKPYDPQKTLL